MGDNCSVYMQIKAAISQMAALLYLSMSSAILRLHLSMSSAILRLQMQNGRFINKSESNSTPIQNRRRQTQQIKLSDPVQSAGPFLFWPARLSSIVPHFSVSPGAREQALGAENNAAGVCPGADRGSPEQSGSGPDRVKKSGPEQFHRSNSLLMPQRSVLAVHQALRRELSARLEF